MTNELFRQKLEESRRKKAEQEAALHSEEYADLIPEADAAFERTEEDLNLDKVIANIGIIEAYNKWCGKSKPTPHSGQTESIKVSCPVPGHVDKNPSAALNTDKNVWVCYGNCDRGGDVYDLAAFAKGLDGYKRNGRDFHRLREEMAADFGYTVTRLAGNVTIVEPSEQENPASAQDEESSTSDVTESEPAVASVTSLHAEDDENDEPILPHLDWRPLASEGTFLHKYMEASIVDDSPEEYHFFHALLALGFALGKDVRLFDTFPVYGNLYICTLGRSGIGKSKSANYLTKLLMQALPFDHNEEYPTGVTRVSSPGSGEVLIDQFTKPVLDPANPKKIIGYAPIKGLINFNELAGLTSRSDRSGSALKSTLQEFYDMAIAPVGTASRGHGAPSAKDAFASALTTTQPRSLRVLLDESDIYSGFLNRWIFVPGTEKKKIAIGGVLADITPAVGSLKEIFGWAGKFGTDDYMQWSPEASNMFTEFHDTVMVPDQKSGSELISRIDLTVKKLILLFSANSKLEVVTTEMVEKAIYCYNYLCESYNVLNGYVGTDEEKDCQEAIMALAEKRFKKDGRGVSISEIQRSLKRRKYPLKLLKHSIDLLTGMRMLAAEETNGVGRKTVRYKYIAS